MRDNLRNLRTGDTILFCRLQMKCQRAVGNALTDERCNCNQTAVAQAEFIGTAPHLTKKDIIVEFRKFWGELTQLVAPCGLYNLFLCHDIDCKKSEY